jgi:hypothetical protein
MFPWPGVIRMSIEAAERGNTGADRVHGRSFLRQRPEYINDFGRERAIRSKRSLQRVEFLAIRQAILVEEMNDLFKRRLAGEFVDVVAGVDQDAFFATHIAQAGFCGNNSFQTFCVRSGCTHSKTLKIGAKIRRMFYEQARGSVNEFKKIVEMRWSNSQFRRNQLDNSTF